MVRLNAPDRVRSGICGLKGRCPIHLDDRGKGVSAGVRSAHPLSPLADRWIEKG